LVALNHFTIPGATFRSSLEKAIVAVERRNDGWASKTRRREPAGLICTDPNKSLYVEAL
jgi:hypothetical protein